jgi:hypothetical protein
LACKPNFRSILAISWASYWSPIRRFGSRFFRRTLVALASDRPQLQVPPQCRQFPH